MQGNTGKHNEIPNYLEVKVCEQSLSLSAKEDGLLFDKHEQDGAPSYSKSDMLYLVTYIWKVSSCSDVTQREVDIKNY